MRRRAAITAFCVALLILPAWGQTRGGSRGFARPVGRFASRSRMSSYSGFSRGRHFRGGFGRGFRRDSFRSRRRFFPYRSFYPGHYGYSYPVVYETGTGYYPSGYSDQSALQSEIDRLSDEIERLRDEQDARFQSAPPSPQRPAAVESTASTVLVFKDKRTQEIQNYAIVGQTLWEFTEQRATRIPLASLDVDATMKLNDQRGVDFHIPN